MSREPEFRRDPVCGRWTIVAPERSDRPQTLEHAKLGTNSFGEVANCPFCPGRESETPHEVLAYRPAGTSPNGPGWQLRVVPNKFPAVVPNIALSPSQASESFFLSQPGLGRAEVIIECAEHLSDPTELSDRQFAAIFQSYRDRLIDLATDERLAYAAIFKNVGAEAGASLAHLHSQIIATPFVPHSIEVELAAAADFYSRESECTYCRLVRSEMEAGTRVVATSRNFLIVTAFAPRFDRELWVLPIAHASRYESISDDACLELAQSMSKLLVALNRAARKPAYNWFLHTSPLRSAERVDYHWHIELLPRTSRPAGFEWGFGNYIATAAPEHSARELRGLIAESHGSQLSPDGLTG